MANRSKNSILETIKYLTTNIPKEAFKTFIRQGQVIFMLGRSGMDFYFADPYCSWQRRCNENSNSLLREFYPKNTNISKNVFLKQLKGAKNTFWDWKSTSKSRIIRSIKGSRGNEEKSQYGKKIFFFKRNDKGHTGKWWITISDILDTGNKAIS